MTRQDRHPLVYLGGPTALRRLARSYLQARGCWSWIELDAPAKAYGPSAKRWAQAVLANCLARSQPGEMVLILAPPSCYQGWVRALRRQGRHVQTPLEGLSLGRMLWRLARWRRTALRRGDQYLTPASGHDQGLVGQSQAKPTRAYRKGQQ